MFTNKFINIMFAVKNCQNLSCSVLNVIVIFSFFFWELHISWVVVLTVNPSLYIECITFYNSKWLAAFSFVIFFYFLVSCDEAVETVMQMCKVQQPTSVLVQNIMCTCNSVFPA